MFEIYFSRLLKIAVEYFMEFAFTKKNKKIILKNLNY